MNKLLASTVLVLCLTVTARADFLFQTGTFSSEGGANGDTIVVSLNFTPKFMMFSHAYTRTTSGAQAINSSYGDYGFSDGTNDAVLSHTILAEGSGPHDGYNFFGKDTVLSLYINFQMQVLSFGTNVCSLYIPNGAGAFLIWFAAWGGSDMTNVKVGYDSTKASTGSQSYTGPGFRPDVVFMAMPPERTSHGTKVGASFTGFGAASASDEEAVMLTYGRDGSSPSQLGGWQATDACLAYVDTVGGTAGDTVSILADFTQFDANGWTMNHSRALATRYLFAYAAIKGGDWKVGAETAKATTGTKETTGLGFTPSSLLMFSHGDTAITGDDIHLHPNFMLGAADGTNEGNVGWNALDGSQNRDTLSIWIRTDKAISFYRARTTASPVLVAEADWSAFASGSFALNWTTADSARQFIFVASGAVPPSAPPLTAGNLPVGGSVWGGR